MKKLFFGFYFLAVVSLSMTACKDDFEEINENRDNTPESSIWHSPEVLTRAQSQAFFLRDHAVGYSYNATTGESYSLDDIRCQVVNRAALDSLKDISPYFLYLTNKEQTTKMEGNVYHSFTQYIQNSNLKAGANGSITLIAGGNAKYECSIFEDGTTDCYIVNSQTKISNGTYCIDADAIMDLYNTYPIVLTSSFRDAVRQVADAPASNFIACVDSFIKTYGTHVVTYAEVGGSLDVLVQFEAKRFKTTENTEPSISADILNGMFTASLNGESTSNGYEYLENAKCRIKVLGGNVRHLDQLVNMNYYRSRNVDISAFNKWKNSVTFDSNCFDNDSTAVINMEFTPIYDFVYDEKAQERIRSVIDNTTYNLISQLGNRNFVNVSFPYKPDNIEYILGNSSTKHTKQNPDIVDMIYAGRHVATICKEQIVINGIDEFVNVVYPIYEGRIQLYNGLCLHNGHIYNIAWNGDNCIVTDKGESNSGNTVYITAGVPSFTAYNNIIYNKAYPIPGMETDMPFNVDGTYNGKSVAYFVKKDKGNFYLPDTKNISNITSIPNWTYDKGSNMMKRNQDYIYIYNPNELRYHEK